MTALKKHDCKQQLRDQCKHIADSITDGKQDPAIWMYDVYDVEWITFNDHKYKAARLMVAGGGPNIWVNLQTGTVDGYWWGDTCKVSFADNLGLDEYMEELHSCR